MLEMAAVCSLNNKASIKYDPETRAFTKYGDPTEVALKVVAEKIGNYDPSLNSTSTTLNYQERPTPYSDYLWGKMKHVATLDFSSERKSMSTVVSGFNYNENTLLLKGAPERVIMKCNSYKL